MNKITKNILALVIVSLGATTIGTAQVLQQKIGDNPTMISPSAVLEIESTNKGALLPRVALTSVIVSTPVTSPADALTVFNTATSGTAPNNVTPGYYYWRQDVVPANSKWVRLIDEIPERIHDLRLVGTNNHITQDAGSGSNGTSVGSGINNIGIGANTLSANTTGSGNTVLGNNAFISNTVNQNATIIGNEAAMNFTSDPVTNGFMVIGSKALKNASIDDIEPSTSILSIGENNLTNASMEEVEGGMLIVGHNILKNAQGLESEGDMTLLGNNILEFGEIDEFSEITVVGNNTLRSYRASGFENIISIGEANFENVTTGDVAGIVAIGQNAFSNVTTGKLNNTVLVGIGGLHSVTSSEGNTAIGDETFRNLIEGKNNSALGFRADVDSNIPGHETLSNATAIGYNAKVGVSNSIVLGATINHQDSTPIDTKVAIGVSVPTEKLDIAGGNLRVRDINTNVGTTTDNIVVADPTGVLKTVAVSSIATQGPTGATGPKGDTGAAGANGTDGATGATGAVGPQGSTGAKGDAGAQGIQGLKGDKGDTGPTGPIGNTGVAGAQGIQGLKGDKGDTGAAGTNGTDGTQGIQGLKGDKGDAGATGSQGSKGDTGAVGPQGPIGKDGVQGPIGLTGLTGATGLQGPIGLTGATGANGTAGVQGLKGDKGDTGPIGATGAAGTNGTNGATGTAGTNGAKGDTGATGAAGTNGTNGAKGDTGLTGPQGPAGVAGPTGTFTATVNNGLNFSTPTNIQLGGSLVKPTTITTDGTNTLAIAGLTTGASTDNVVVSSTAGVLKTVASSTLAIEPWNVSGTTNKATLNTQNIYQKGKVGIGSSAPYSALTIVNDNQADSYDDISIETFGTGTNTPAFIHMAAGGTLASPTRLTNNSFLGSMYFRGFLSDSQYHTLSGIQVKYKGNGTTKLSNMEFYTSNTDGNADPKMILTENGNLAIGATTIPTAEVTATNPRLYVVGNITTTGKVYTTNSVYADYVFEKYFNGKSAINPDYEFKSLNYVRDFIKANNHLPGVRSIGDLKKEVNGYKFDMTELSIQSLEKIEELYLHTIEQKETIDQQQAEIDTLKKASKNTAERLEILEKLLLK